MRRTVQVVALLLLTAVLTVASFAAKRFAPTMSHAAGKAGPTLRHIATFDLPGPPGKRFDYLTIDYDDGYLLSAHLGMQRDLVDREHWFTTEEYLDGLAFSQLSPGPCGGRNCRFSFGALGLHWAEQAIYYIV